MPWALVGGQVPTPSVLVDFLKNNRGETVDKTYYDAVSQMEQMNIDKEYQLGWMGGYLNNPSREEQRLTEAYEAGYEDGSNQVTDNFGEWVK